MLIKDTLDISDVTWKNEIKGNFSKLAFVHKEQKHLVKALYGPNKDSVESDNNNESTKVFIWPDMNWKETSPQASYARLTKK